MAKPLPPPFDKQKVVAENRRARFDYFIEERFEAGVQLTGTEVKSLRQGEGSSAEVIAQEPRNRQAPRSGGAPRADVGAAIDVLQWRRAGEDRAGAGAGQG